MSHLALANAYQQAYLAYLVSAVHSLESQADLQCELKKNSVRAADGFSRVSMTHRVGAYVKYCWRRLLMLCNVAVLIIVDSSTPRRTRVLL